jgi:CheY-like chemotaxis protein
MKKPSRILIIDDDTLVTTVFSRALKLDGYDVAVVNHAEEAIASVLVFQPDLILLDFNLAGTSGAEILAQIRATPGIERVRTAFVSGSRVACDFLDEWTWFLSKPLHMNALREAARYIIGSEHRCTDEEQLVPKFAGASSGSF